ncbi:hypothetical protein [Paraferrimonas sedimenticola]|uniref:Cysteine-rich secretory protein family protein n=1 Tax=Paraferrimonas sedimenticola TaxID=375674 RepID=A0AA37RZT9_9GAMM|nr:hypothetical protein [Paraferrimonas sedimenticola]GLP97717.1 hypothetical protein GCM10007895_30240 [Paraferrimonas sedimenticola]
MKWILAPILMAYSATAVACGNSPQAKALAEFIIKDPQQQRDSIICDPRLVSAAAQKAQQMASAGLVAHNLGVSPNTFVEEAGFDLPYYYAPGGNQVEAIAGGYPSAEEVWAGFKKSTSGHKEHLLGTLDFYREQDRLGVGYFYDWDTPHIQYWVVYLTKGTDDSPPPSFESTPNKGNEVMLKREVPKIMPTSER